MRTRRPFPDTWCVPEFLVSFTTTDYDELGRVTVSTDRFGAETHNTYNLFGEVTETRSEVEDETGNTVWRVTRTVYDDQGRGFVSTDPFLIDGNDVILTGTIMASMTIYDVLGRAKETRRLEGVTVDIDSEGETTLTNDGEVISISKSYWNDKGQLERTHSLAEELEDGVAPVFREMTYEYDDFGRQFAVIDHAIDIGGITQQHRNETVYDAQGRAFQQISNIVQLADGTLDRTDEQITTSHYDEFGRQVETEFDDSTSTETIYDDYGRVEKEIDQLGNEKTFEYDRHGRLTAVELPAIDDPDDATNNLIPPRYEYRYDARGNMVGIRDPLYGHTVRDANSERETTFTFDERGNQLTRTMPDGLVESFVYDDFGRQVQHTSFEDVVTEYIYDDVGPVPTGRLDQKNFYATTADYNSSTISETLSMSYDAFGQNIEMEWDRDIANPGTDVDSWINEFDERRRLIRTESPTGSINYEYDDLGRKTRVFTGDSGTYAGDQADPINDFEYGYDLFGRLASVTTVERNDVTVDVSTDPGDQPEIESYVYDLLSRCYGPN